MLYILCEENDISENHTLLSSILQMENSNERINLNIFKNLLCVSNKLRSSIFTYNLLEYMIQCIEKSSTECSIGFVCYCSLFMQKYHRIYSQLYTRMLVVFMHRIPMVCAYNYPNVSHTIIRADVGNLIASTRIFCTIAHYMNEHAERDHNMQKNLLYSISVLHRCIVNYNGTLRLPAGNLEIHENSRESVMEGILRNYYCFRVDTHTEMLCINIMNALHTANTVEILLSCLFNRLYECFGKRDCIMGSLVQNILVNIITKGQYRDTICQYIYIADVIEALVHLLTIPCSQALCVTWITVMTECVIIVPYVTCDTVGKIVQIIDTVICTNTGCDCVLYESYVSLLLRTLGACTAHLLEPWVFPLSIKMLVQDTKKCMNTHFCLSGIACLRYIIEIWSDSAEADLCMVAKFLLRALIESNDLDLLISTMSLLAIVCDRLPESFKVENMDVMIAINSKLLSQQNSLFYFPNLMEDTLTVLLIFSSVGPYSIKNRKTINSVYYEAMVNYMQHPITEVNNSIVFSVLNLFRTSYVHLGHTLQKKIFLLVVTTIHCLIIHYKKRVRLQGAACVVLTTFIDYSTSVMLREPDFIDLMKRLVANCEGRINRENTMALFLLHICTTHNEVCLCTLLPQDNQSFLRKIGVYFQHQQSIMHKKRKRSVCDNAMGVFRENSSRCTLDCTVHRYIAELEATALQPV